MSLMGKAIGAGVGSVLGPIGTLVGGFIGHLYDEHCESTQADQEAALMRYRAACALLSLHASAASVNGSSAKKARLLNTLKGRVCEDFQVVEGPELPIRAELCAEECAETLKLFPQDAQSFVFRDMMSICSADGLDDTECLWLERVMQGAGLPADTGMLFWFFTRPNEASGRQEALKVLDLAGNPAEEEIKSAYRRKCMDYHPDRLGTVVPEHILKLAEEKMREVALAYELLTSKAAHNGLALVRPSGDLLAAGEVTRVEVVNCALCGQSNRLKPDTLTSSRCGACFAFLALPEELLRGMKLDDPPPKTRKAARPAKERRLRPKRSTPRGASSTRARRKKPLRRNLRIARKK